MAADLTSVSEHRRSQPPKLIRESARRSGLDSDQGDGERIVHADTRPRMDWPEDLRRFLKNESSQPMHLTPGYRFWKMVGRNRLWFGALTTIGTILIVGLVAVTIALTRERTARGEAVAQKNLARREAARSEQVTRFHEENA